MCICRKERMVADRGQDALTEKRDAFDVSTTTRGATAPVLPRGPRRCSTTGAPAIFHRVPESVPASGAVSKERRQRGRLATGTKNSAQRFGAADEKSPVGEARNVADEEGAIRARTTRAGQSCGVLESQSTSHRMGQKEKG
jgi:hypothetical protein